MFISWIWFQPLDTFLYKILSGDLSTNFFFRGGVVILKEQYDFCNRKFWHEKCNSFIWNKHTILKKTHKLDRKKIKMGEKEMREKYEKRKKN